MAIVDARDVPIAGARADLQRTTSVEAVESDLAGRLHAVVFPANRAAVIVSAPGARPQVVEELSDGLVVKLGPAGTLTVRVIGIPAEQPIVLGDALEPSTELRLSDAEVESLRRNLERMCR